MDQEIAPTVDTSLAARAFEELRAEISLLRRAVERLTDERTSQPDYAPSLEAVSKRLEDVCVWARCISEKPALKLTPASLVSDLISAADDCREQDHQRLDRAVDEMKAAGDRIDALIARSRSASEQNRELTRNQIAFAVAGMALFSILPGAVARSLPVSWAMPERMAARMLGQDMWHAGQHMMAKANPEEWRAIVQRQRKVAAPQAKH